MTNKKRTTELTVAEAARLTGRSEDMLRWFIKQDVLKARKVEHVRREHWLIEVDSLIEQLVMRDRPKPRGPKPRWLTGAARTRSLGFKPANPDRTPDAA